MKLQHYAFIFGVAFSTNIFADTNPQVSQDELKHYCETIANNNSSDKLSVFMSCLEINNSNDPIGALLKEKNLIKWK